MHLPVWVVKALVTALRYAIDRGRSLPHLRGRRLRRWLFGMLISVLLTIGVQKATDYLSRPPHPLQIQHVVVDHLTA